MRLKYKAWVPGIDAMAEIERANAICAEFAAQGYDLTLRQLYYQFVARDYIPNNIASYNRLGEIINKARLAGLLDWEYIVDRTRNLSGANHFDKPQDAVLKAARSFSQDLWRNQPVRIEVWVEKEALSQVVSRAASQHDVDHFSCRGYVSQSELWAAGQRLLAYILGGQRVVILHLGDHDPSGIDMTRDINERLRMFLARDYHRANIEELGTSTTMGAIWTHMNRRTGGSALEVNRIALNMDQVERYSPPPNPAKVTDSRYASYRELYGAESWELDALTPQVLDELIQRNIVVERDDAIWDTTVAEEESHRAMMVAIAERWTELKGALNI
jgi:hypothetical protein